MATISIILGTYCMVLGAISTGNEVLRVRNKLRGRSVVRGHHVYVFTSWATLTGSPVCSGVGTC